MPYLGHTLQVLERPGITEDNSWTTRLNDQLQLVRSRRKNP
jgi:hypothetical protein